MQTIKLDILINKLVRDLTFVFDFVSIQMSVSFIISSSFNFLFSARSKCIQNGRRVAARRLEGQVQRSNKLIHIPHTRLEHDTLTISIYMCRVGV